MSQQGEIMAWNPSSKVAADRDAANKFNYPKAVLILVNEKTGNIEAASYGQTKKMCDECGELADFLLEKVQDFYLK